MILRKISEAQASEESFGKDEQKLYEELFQNEKLQKPFIGFYYDGVQNEEMSTKIDEQAITKIDDVFSS